MRSSEQVERLLVLVPFVQSRPGVSVASVAEHFGVSPDQIVRDLKVLWMCGLPGGLPGDLIDIDMEAAEGDGVIHLDNADYLARPLRFTPDEATALVVALQAVLALAGDEQAVAVASAIGKLQGVAGEAVERVAIKVSSGEQQVRSVLGTAIEARRRVRLTYDGLTRGETTHPEVDPVQLMVRDGVGYLRAWSLERAGWRTYRLDRIVEADPTGDPSAEWGEPPPLGDTWFDDATGATEVTLDLTPSAVWITEYYPTIEVRPHEDGVRVRLAVLDPAWLTARLLRLADAVSVLDPPQAADDAVEQATEAIEVYRRFGLTGSTAEGTEGTEPAV